MNPVAIMLVVHATLTSASTENYVNAHQAMNLTGQPMVVLVGADWCPACVTMKESVLPEVKRNGDLSGVGFAKVNLDQEPELAQQLLSGTTIPQLLVVEKNPDGGLKQTRFTGLQSSSLIASTIRAAAERAGTRPKIVQ